MMSDHDAYLDALRQVIDPELMINIVDLGLVYEVSDDPAGTSSENPAATATAAPPEATDQPAETTADDPTAESSESVEESTSDVSSADNGDGKHVSVQMTLTSPACPAGPQIVQQAKMALERLDDVSEATITLVMSPPWSPDRMTDDARDQLGIF